MCMSAARPRRSVPCAFYRRLVKGNNYHSSTRSLHGAFGALAHAHIGRLHAHGGARRLHGTVLLAGDAEASANVLIPARDGSAAMTPHATTGRGAHVRSDHRSGRRTAASREPAAGTVPFYENVSRQSPEALSAPAALFPVFLVSVCFMFVIQIVWWIRSGRRVPARETGKQKVSRVQRGRV